ncbi:arrestin [Colletotrichum scovillei]|uniref:Arrestin n=2 Tax=Colletotrichum scovillei TaxID=1209932 RepID=A0A9P7QWF2_9PEZI|nr:arrestin [Colletotrichum scovillei]KAG7041541.1 arrestin [Colletotrichum scovillei]KAG7061569.1 arrestin [Colletotrichum scovillei]
MWSAASKMPLDIKIDDHYSSKIYTSGSHITGSVSICPDSRTPFHCIQIALMGTSHTRVDMLPVPKITTDVFLNLDMPITKTSYPQGQVFAAGETHIIPFNFTIPRELHKDACEAASGDHSHDQHMRLPPSMGGWGKDDMSPTMAQVEYKIVARLLRKRSSSPKDTTEASQRIMVLPAFAEDPPLNINNHDARYTLSRTKSVRRSLLSTQKDRIVINALQPEAVYISIGGHQLPDSHASVTLDLSFESTSSFSFPPEVTLGQVKLDTQTWFTGTPMKMSPDLGDPREAAGLRHELRYSTQTKLPTTDTGVILWHRDDQAEDRKVFSWRSRTKVPIRLPTAHKMFLPTFFNCFIARSYILRMSVNFNGSKTSLSVPLQIASQSLYPQVMEPEVEDLPSFDASLAWR